jgi:hypothetical protein
MTKLNRKLIFYIIGLLLLFNGIAMLSSSLVSLITNDGVLKEVTSYCDGNFLQKNE